MSRQRAAAPEDSRNYVRVSVDLPLNPKLAELDDPAASWLYVVSLCYSGQSFTDGHFPVTIVTRLAGVDSAAAEKLVAQGLWHRPEHDCGRCEQPKHGYVVVHDYLRHQRSANEVNDLSEKRREAGRRGAERRWGSKTMANAMPTAMANGSQTGGREEESREDLSLRTAEPPRAEVAKLCDHLRARVIANGSKASVTEKWLTDARLLLDRDGRDLDEALRLIDWATQDPFWRTNILSMPKFRKQYDQLRLKAAQDPNWRHLRAVDSIPDDELNPDDVLGLDTWTAPAPPREIDEGPPEQRRAWYRQAADAHKQERLSQARAAIARQQSRGTA
ncbi:hypothetical protein PV646_34175 [Streptomyces sp. ID05-26A]|nr:hypothetical protein [Streptomyces sp. ID05-26A]